MEAQGINVIIEKRTTDKEVEENLVLDQTPKTGEKVTSGDYVTLYIPNVDKYPDFTTGDYRYEDVVDYLKKYEVTVNKNEKADASVSPGIVIGQSRAKGSPIVKGTSVTITVAKKSSSKTSGDEKCKSKDSNGKCCGDPGALC